MDYQEFKDTLLKKILEILPPSIKLEESNIEKNNSIYYEALNFVPAADENISIPVLHIESLYEMYRESCSMNVVMDHIKDALDARVYIDKDLLEYLPKDKVFIKVVNVDRNKELITRIPCKISGDFLFTYHILLNKNETGIASARITNELFEKYNISFDKLDKIAMENTQRIFPLKFQKLQDEILEGELGFEVGKTDKIYVDINEKDDMFVLTNQSKADGATVLFYPGVKETLAEQFPEGAYIIPYSVDELLVVSYNVVFESQMTEERMIDMIKEINTQLLKPEEILSDVPYFLDGETAEMSRVHDKKKSYAKADIQNQNSWTSDGKRLYRQAEKSIDDSGIVTTDSKLENGVNIEDWGEIDIEP